MKDLIEKTALCSAPGIFTGQQKLTDFEYTPGGTQVRWRGQGDFVPIGLLSVHEVLPEEETPAPVGLRDVPKDVRERIVAKAVKDKDAEIEKLKAQLAKTQTPARKTEDEFGRPVNEKGEVEFS